MFANIRTKRFLLIEKFDEEIFLKIKKELNNQLISKIIKATTVINNAPKANWFIVSNCFLKNASEQLNVSRDEILDEIERKLNPEENEETV